MSFPLSIKEGARCDIGEVFQRYGDISDKLAEEFLGRLDEAFQRIAAEPESYPRVFQDIRQMRVRRFPYVVSYLFEDDRIVILAVLHGHRNPSEWRHRG